MAASYRIITGEDNTVTTVIARRHIFSIFRTVRPAARRYSRRLAQSGSRAVHSDRSPVCAAAARPGHQCSDRKYLRKLVWLEANAPAREAAEALRERPATKHTRLCSARPASYRDRRVYGHAVQAASRRICNRLAPDHGCVQPVPFPAAAIRRERGQATLRDLMVL